MLTVFLLIVYAIKKKQKNKEKNETKEKMKQKLYTTPVINISTTQKKV